MRSSISGIARLWIKDNWHVLLVALIVLAGVFARLRGYGNLTLSIATDDTPAFVDASHLPLLSWRFLTSNRPATIALMYKLLEPASGYEVNMIGRPAEGKSTLKTPQSGMDRVVFAQTILSILCWSLLAIAAARRVHSRPLKLVMAGTILAFGFSPQLAEWDSILLSEPVSFSLFALLLAITLELAARIVDQGRGPRFGTWILGGVWILITTLWVFSRDSNAYALPVTVALIAFSLAILSIRRRVASWLIRVVAVLLVVLFGLQTRSLYASDRWVNPFLNNLIYRVFPDRSNLAFFQDHGMPVTPEVLSFRNSRGNETGFLRIEPLMAWIQARGAATYASFLVLHPQWSFITLLNNLQLLFSENRQPYFTGPSGYRVDWTVPVGSMLSIQSSGVVLLDLLLTVLVVAVVAIRRMDGKYGLAWVLAWLMIVELAILFVSFYGDSLGVVRHALVAVIPLRLSTWMLTVFAADLVLEQGERSLKQQPQADAPSS
jgi:hypothetical protein